MKFCRTFHNGDDLNQIKTYVREDDSKTIETEDELRDNINVAPEKEHILEDVTNLLTNRNTSTIFIP